VRESKRKLIIRSFKLGRYAVRELNFQGFERSDIQCGWKFISS
jgi:ribosomal protein S14